MYRGYKKWDKDFGDLHRAEYFTHRQGTDAVKSLIRYKKICQQSEIVLIGHSWGGNTAYDVAVAMARFNPHLVTLDAVGIKSKWYAGIPLLWGLTIQDNKLKKPGLGVWLNVYTEVANYYWNAYISFPLGIVQIFRFKRLHWCDAIAFQGGPYGRQRYADPNGFKLSKIYNHCDVDVMISKMINVKEFTDVLGKGWAEKFRKNWLSYWLP